MPKTGNETVTWPAGTTNFSNVSGITLKVLAYNQSMALLLAPGGKQVRILLINSNNPGTRDLTAEQRRLAEQIALANSRVQDILGAGMYTEDIQPLDSIQVNEPEASATNGTYASIAFTIVNTTTAENETTFFVHVDLDNGRVIRISPLFSQG